MIEWWIDRILLSEIYHSGDLIWQKGVLASDIIYLQRGLSVDIKVTVGQSTFQYISCLSKIILLKLVVCYKADIFWRFKTEI